ncbi:MAG: ATP-grasp domain-containing protein [Ignavibacteriota bacterium]
MRVALLANIKPDDNVTSPGGPFGDDTYAEWDSLETVQAVCDALNSHPDVEAEIVEALAAIAIPRLMVRAYDIVFNIAEGMRGASREAQFPAVMEMLGIPYTGSGLLTLATALDKARTKEVLQHHQIPVARFTTSSDTDTTLAKLLPGVNYPVVVKPLSEGSSKGVKNSSFAQNDKDLSAEILRISEDYSQSAIIEEFLPGREFTVAVLGNGSDTQVLPIVEIRLSELPSEANGIYSYEAKWIYDVRDNPLDIFSCPADLTPELKREIEKTVLATYRVLDCKDWSRIDVRLDSSGKPNIIEVNPLPGILPKIEDNSCFPKAARTAGMDYDKTMLAVLRAGCKRYGIQLA